MRLIGGVCLLALAGCGSDGGSGATASTPVTSTPAPTASVTNVTAFSDLTGTVTLQSVNSGFLTNFSPPQEAGVNAFGSGVRYIYTPATRTIAVDNGPGSATFTAADIDATAPSGTTRYIKATGENLILIQPAPLGTGLRWTRFIENTGNAPANTRIIAVTGVPTPVSDIPASGTVTFARTQVIGNAYIRTGATVTPYVLVGSTLTASINYSTKRISFTLTLNGQPNGSTANISLATITGTTDFDGQSPSISVASSTYTRTDGFAFGAALFGTAAAEAGGVFVYRGSNADSSNVVNLVGRFAASTS